MIPDATQPAPAPGESAGRTEGTENNYLKRALWFASHVGKNLGLDEPTPTEVVTFAMQKREQWSKSTWRQTKASLMFRYESMGTTSSLEAVRLLREHGDQSMCLQTSKRTSGLRAKKVSEKKLSTVIKRIRASSSAYSAMLESWLIMGSICGLRPHEWTQASLIWGAPSEIDPLGAGAEANQLDLERPYLRVENAKTSNGRGHGQYRHLDLSGMSMVMLGAIDRFATAMRKIKENGDYVSCYMACQQLLYRLNTGASIEGSQDLKWIQIYSARHVFSSRAKRVLKPEQVSAAMGHATDRTAHSHYGRRTNEGGGVGLIPVQTEVAKVRLKRKSYADAVLAARAKTPASSGPSGDSASS